MAACDGMAILNAEHDRERTGVVLRADTLVLIAIASAVFLLHLLTNGRYGFHRDELQFLSDARHLDWGFVPYPPFTPFIERMGLGIFGLSLVGLRLFSVISQVAAIAVTGLMARELGAGRLGQVVAALAVALAPMSLFEGTEFQYTTFDYLWWVLIGYFTIRLLQTENPRWWLAIGALVGIGLLTKYTIVFLVCGILGGTLLTRVRRFLSSGWFWAGIGIATLMFLPNLLWQVHHGFISLHFLQHIHQRDVAEGRANGFLRQQFFLCTDPIVTPLWVAGLALFLRSGRYRMLAWMYLIPLALFLIGKGRGYYLAAAYPTLIAMGAAGADRWVTMLSPLPRRVLAAIFISMLIAHGLYISTMILPLASHGPLMDFALKNNGDLREEFGWDELVRTVAGIRDSLPPEQRDHAGIFVSNYGEQGAIEILGPPYHLPLPISWTNSTWLRGYPEPAPSILIVLGLSRKSADRLFTACRLAGHNGNPYGIHNEESDDHPDIFLCAAPREPWPQFWNENRHFG